MHPIHYAIMNSAPLVVIQRLYNLYKDGIKETHADGWLPLHMACYYDNYDATVWLKKKYPQGVMQRDKSGRTANDLAKHYKKMKALEAFPQVTPVTTPIEEMEESATKVPEENKNEDATGTDERVDDNSNKTEESPSKSIV